MREREDGMNEPGGLRGPVGSSGSGRPGGSGRSGGMDGREPDRRALLLLEWRAYRGYLPLNAAMAGYWVLIMAVLLAAVLIFIGDGFPAESMFALGAALVFVCALYAGGGMAMTIWENRFREWWLGLPFSRRTLVGTKLIAACGMQGFVAAGLWIVCLAYGIVCWSGQDETGAMLDGGSLAGTALAYAALCAALIPLGVSVGYSLLGMYYGWRRWLLIPWLIVLTAPLPLLGIVPALRENQMTYLDGEHVFLYACVCAALAAAAYRGCLALTAGRGVSDLSRHRPGSLAGLGARRRERASHALGARRIGSGFAAVYALERSRYRYWMSIMPARIVYICLILISVVGGFFGARAPLELLDALRGLLVLPCLLPSVVITTMLAHEGNKRRIEWWLGLPYSRSMLLAARLLAIWAFTVRAVGGWLVAAAIGFAVGGHGGLAYFSPGEHLGALAYLFAIFALCAGTVTALTLTQIYSQRNALLTWLFVPLGICIYFLPSLINRWVVTEKLLAGPIGADRWLWAAGGAVALLALLPFCVRAGAAWLHVYIFNTYESRQRRRGEQSFKFRS